MATAHKAIAGAVLVWSASVGMVSARSASPSSARPQSASLSGGRLVLAQSPTLGLGRTPTPEELKAIDIDIRPDGTGLPAGTGTAASGKDVYTRRCETCHGPTGKEGPQDVLVGGKGSLATAKPQKTIGSYWPYATTLWDYIRRAMPFDHPGTLTADEIYGTTAYLLFLNGIVGEHDPIDQATLPQVQMPNRNGFTPDPRPDIGVTAKPQGTASPQHRKRN